METEKGTKLLLGLGIQEGYGSEALELVREG